MYIHRMRTKTGFTLLELIIVIVIVGVLASLALPKLFSVIEGARAAEALSAIASIRSAMERCYLMNNGSYMGCAFGPGYNFLTIDDPGTSPNAHFTYNIPLVSSLFYVIIADRNALDGGVTVDHRIVMGFGIQPQMQPGGGTSLLAGEEGKIYWDASPAYKGFVPKSN